jgi:EAL domain-containing protein (putative c-di-GMP-specific phosphodiesterase class I)
VESGGQADFLRDLGCEQAQGFLFARPMAAADFTAHIDRQRPKAAPRRRSKPRKR